MRIRYFSRMIALALLLSMGAMGDMTQQLTGLWILQKMEMSGRTYQDPRWTCSLELNSQGEFNLNSTTVQEVYLEAKDGTRTTRATQNSLSIRATYALEKDALRLVLNRPVEAPQREFAARHFGPPGSDGSYLVKCRLQGGLYLDAGTSSLLFQRHEKRS